MSPTVRRRVLIVDDDPSIRRLLVTFIRRQGLLPLEACDGAEALAAMQAGEADVAILDLMMPGVSGRDVLRQRASSLALRLIPVIVVTAGDVDDVADELAGQYVSSFIGKPFDLDTLLQSLKECLTFVAAPAAA